MLKFFESVECININRKKLNKSLKLKISLYIIYTHHTQGDFNLRTVGLIFEYLKFFEDDV